MAPHFHWTGRKYFTTEASQCLQLAKPPFSEVGYAGSEDCLYLNIHTTTPKVQPQRLPSVPPIPQFTPNPNSRKRKTTMDPLLAVHNNNNINNTAPSQSVAEDNDIGGKTGYHDLLDTKNTTAFPSTSDATSSAPSQRLKPVVVWVHGGSYNVGWASSDTNGTDYLVAKVCISSSPLKPYLKCAHRTK